MDVFELRNSLVDDYKSYTRSFIKIKDQKISDFVESKLAREGFWPEPLLQLNPTFKSGGTIDDLVEQGVLHAECAKIFRFNDEHIVLHEHQRQAILKASKKQSCILTSGTGSGKSLGYIVPIVDHILRNGTGQGIQAIIVYPMNALANSQKEELLKFLPEQEQAPVTFDIYTGQERSEARERIRATPPDILLTNYMMLELLLTRVEDRQLVRAAHGLQFLVFDELHTYRGRQGADVALLIRRCRQAFGNKDTLCIGTSATMVSKGSSEDQRDAVARVAQALFGIDFTSEQIINETLERATPEIEITDPNVLGRIRQALGTEQEVPTDYETFRSHPLASWIESAFGIRTEEGTVNLVRRSPRRIDGEQIEGVKNAASELAEISGVNSDACAEVLRRWLLAGAGLRQSESSRFPVFAFRLHQFFTRGDTVWATLEAGMVRHLEIAKTTAKPGDLNKLLFPLVFCRHCGAAYYRVGVQDDGQNQLLLPREDSRRSDDDSIEDAYLYISDGSPWPSGDENALLSRVPEYMKETTAADVERIRRDARKNLPEPVSVSPGGAVVSDGQGTPAVLIRGNFLFCLDCGIAYTRQQRSERFKLATLGVDSRSTATTILALRSLIALRGNRELQPEARKLLSFTDNRQDASLQAGHFNDFTQVALLRSALYQALEQQGTVGLEHEHLASKVFTTMALRPEEYAADPDVQGQAKQDTNDALCRVIEYFLYRDLERGWRVTAPNLEDCALLRFEYKGLTGEDSLLGDTELWKSGLSIRTGRTDKRFMESPVALRGLSTQILEELLRTLLDVMRRALAVKADVLDRSEQQVLVRRTNTRLHEDTVWYLDDTRDLTSSLVAYPRSRRRGEQNNLFISSRSGYGRYLKRTISGNTQKQNSMKGEQVNEIIQFLLVALQCYGIVEQVRSGRDGNDPGYQINPGAVRWLPGDGQHRPVDHTRILAVGEFPPDANKYFVKIYREFVTYRCTLEAREHTAQVTHEDRKDREERFRTAELPLLFCSPTMELGVDIAELNLVNLRNVPPTPANYAQRSGRAGRGGQPALVFTYCAGRSPHDQYFYREPTRMVAGAVVPPRIDLNNRALIRSHIHAIWMEEAKLDLGKTLESVLDLLRSADGTLPLPVKNNLLEELRNPAYRMAAQARARALFSSIEFEPDSPSWLHNGWIDEVLNQLERSFDSACNRWRTLYRAAKRQRALHHKILDDCSRTEAEHAQSRRLRAQAESQAALLTAAKGIYEGDFYSWRYFAAEGLLPGYNFPRLPLSAYVPGRRRRMRNGRSEYLSRPRFLAISEFGPRALIYHEGARYRVSKVNLDYESDDIEGNHELRTKTMKRCSHCGYAHMEDGAVNLSEMCQRCNASFEPDSRIDSLVQMQNVSLQLNQRIICDEEERQRFGYQLVTAYSFPEVSGSTARKDAEVIDGESVLLRLHYGDATDLYRINQGWAHQRQHQPPGFNLDVEGGFWSRNQADDADKDAADCKGRIQRVVPYVEDAKNALVIGLASPLSGPEMASLQAALKQAIVQNFQLEPRELSSEPMPTRDNRREILFYEASEGGAGVLRQIIEDPEVMPELAKCALRVCHYDPVSLDDLAPDRCGKACYECLLDFTNQPDHQHMDRQSIRDLLGALARSECRPAGGMGSRSVRLDNLKKQCDSKLEKRWLDEVDRLLLRLPSDAQYRVQGHYTQADFFYSEYNTAIYIDGPPHDSPEQLEKDESITRKLKEAGYIVIRFHHQDDWIAVFQRHPDIFGVART